MLTAYEVAKLANSELRTQQLAEIPSQMIYNYVRKNYIASVTTEEGVRISEQEAARWISEYVSRKRDREDRKLAKIQQELSE